MDWNLSIVLCLNSAFCALLKKSFPEVMVLFPRSSSKNLIIFLFTFMSLTFLELVFGDDPKIGVQFNFST